jgi:hypothetical protein
VINVVGDGTELLLNNRPAESGALRFEIVGLLISVGCSGGTAPWVKTLVGWS